jgi:assimilatory nitrate reductase catalytic subunit
MSTAWQGYKRSFGSEGPPGSYEDLEKADVIILIGANQSPRTIRSLCWRLRSNPATTLIVVGSARPPRRDDGRPAPAAQPALGSGA